MKEQVEERVPIAEYESPVLEPNMAFQGDEQCSDASVLVGCPESGEVALHIQFEAEDAPNTSIYMTPVEAARLLERLGTAIWVAESI